MFARIILTGVSALLLVGCAGRSAPQNLSWSSPLTVEGTTWELMSFATHALRVPQRAWIRLEGGRYTGFAGCNGLSGSYTEEGGKIRFTMDPHTMRACPDIKGETEFRKRLLSVDRYRFESDMLVLVSGDKPVLEFMEKE